MSEIKIYTPKTPKRLIYKGALIINVVFVLPLYCIWWLDGETEILWIASAVVAFSDAIVLFAFAKRRPHIILNSEGVYLRQRGRQVFKWDVIQDVYIMEPDYEGWTFLNFVIEEKYLPFIGKWYEKLVSYQDDETAIERLNYPLDNLDVDKKELLNLIKSLINADESEREVLLKRGVE